MTWRKAFKLKIGLNTISLGTNLIWALTFLDLWQYFGIVIIYFNYYWFMETLICIMSMQTIKYSNKCIHWIYPWKSNGNIYKFHTNLLNREPFRVSLRKFIDCWWNEHKSNEIDVTNLIVFYINLCTSSTINHYSPW